MGFQSGLSGLNASAKNLDVIGNNVANSNTVGFKSSRAVFADVFASSLAGAGASNIGIGTKVSSVLQEFTQGNITVTSNPLDLAINGRGFLRLDNNGAVAYSRNGQLHLDEQGYIVNGDNLRLTGYPVDATGNIVASAPMPLQLSTSDIAPHATGGMLDQQLAQAMADRGLGLADVMVRQLSRTAASAAPDGSKAPSGPTAPDAQNAPAAAPANTGAATSIGERARAFVDRFWNHAVDASRETGLPAHFILGQAALESGWGTRETRSPDGAPTHNLFNIKAGQSWRGDSAAATTTEYAGATAQKTSARFRSYPSYEAAFRDYANLLKSNGRYSRVLESGGDAAQFANELQKAGYATDPGYAAKLTRIITGSVLRGGLSA